MSPNQFSDKSNQSLSRAKDLWR